MTEFDQRLGRRLRASRLAKGMTLEESGAVVGVSNQQMQKYESGENRIALEYFEKLAHAYGKPVASFFPDKTDQTDLMTEFFGIRGAHDFAAVMVETGAAAKEIFPALTDLISATMKVDNGDKSRK